MNQYLSFFKIRFSTELQYRFAAIAGILTQLFWGIMLIMIYEAYYSSGIDAAMEWQSLVSYIWINQSLIVFASLTYSDLDIKDSILTRAGFV